MKRVLRMTALLAMGLLVASSFAAAQESTLPKDFLFGHASISLLGRDNVDSSKFQEYRDLSRGVFGPQFSLVGSKQSIDFALYGQNIQQQDQRYFGQASFGWGGITFDYNQTPHNMGNNGQSILSQTAPGVYSLSPTLRKSLGSAADSKLPTTARTYDFYTPLLAPTFASTNNIDLTALRQRGSVEFDLGQNLPFDLSLIYTREHKSGTRGGGGGDIVGAISPVIDVPEPLDEVVQDVGVRAAYNFKAGNVHASFNRNVYDNRAETLTIDNPFQAADVAYTAAKGAIPPLGGPGSVRFVNAPDNEASTGRFGLQLKFKRQTRITGDVGLASWTQNATFYPYTINSTILTPTGVLANSVSSLQQPSLDGKIRTTTLNFALLSRPAPGLGIRMRYRSYDLSNKTARWVITGDTSGSPDRSWGAATVSADAPYGHATANNYDSTTKRFEASASYDVKSVVTLEGVGRYASLTRTNREATSGKDKGGAFSAVFHASEWLGVRASVDRTRRTAIGTNLVTIDQGGSFRGFQADEAERTMTRTGVDIELTPAPTVGVSFGYFRRKIDYPNRPNCVARAAGTSCGLLGGKYDSFTSEVEFAPNERAEFSGYYTYEKDSSTNRWGRTLATNMMTYAGSDKTNTFGANAVFHVVPDKWTFSLTARHQNVDGLMGVSTDPANNFWIYRASVGGPQDIVDYDDTKLTTGVAQLDYTFSKTWTVSVGYAYEKYSFADAYTSGAALMPQAVLIFMKPNSGGYHANLGFATLGYRF